VLEEQMKRSLDHLKTWLPEELSSIIETDSFEEGLYAHLTGGYEELTLTSTNKIKRLIGHCLICYQYKYQQTDQSVLK
jgi:hypothetical protein